MFVFDAMFGIDFKSSNAKAELLHASCDLWIEDRLGLGLPGCRPMSGFQDRLLSEARNLPR
jgi:hypothetical protein